MQQAEPGIQVHGSRRNPLRNGSYRRGSLTVSNSEKNCTDHRPGAELELSHFTGAEGRAVDNYSSKDSGPSFVYNWTKEGPMTTITPEIRKAIEQAGEQPVRLADLETNLVYIIVRAEVYECMCVLCDDFDIQDAYPLMNQVAAREGWDDPSMDIYNEYQPPSG